MALAVPLRRLLARPQQHLPADGIDEPGFLEQRDEVVRLHDAAGRMVPAHQRFDTRDLAVAQVEDRLVLEEELVAFDGVAEIHL